MHTPSFESSVAVTSCSARNVTVTDALFDGSVVDVAVMVQGPPVVGATYASEFSVGVAVPHVDVHWTPDNATLVPVVVAVNVRGSPRNNVVDPGAILTAIGETVTCAVALAVLSCALVAVT